MKKKVEYLLLAAVIVGALAYLMLRETDRTRYALPQLTEVTGTALTGVEIAKGDKTISLAKKEDRWHIFPGDFPADGEKAAGILDSAAKLSFVARVSESKNYARYDLGDDRKIRVKAFSGDAVKRDFEIGSTASTFRHTHVKISGDPNVYQAQGNLKSKFDVTVDDLRDRTVLSFDTTRVQEFSIMLNGKSVMITKKLKAENRLKENADTPKTEPQSPEKQNFVWETEGGRPVDEAKVKRLLSSLVGLRCQKYLEGFKVEDFKDPEIEIAIKADKEHILKFFKKDDKDQQNRSGTSSDNAYPFLIAKPQIQDISSFVEDLKKAESKQKLTGES
ncbi:MAG: hypothetical protein COX20_01030 [Desulfobacterales bacterium CG23_combo_of_CG06-09_8_20_14_all_52_9]|nr:MAG: hypothetical protein COX20_01030 [Desulfobacterales bacterium CG23_combo_of_CG06-09_8_20_14_all_52_9]